MYQIDNKTAVSSLPASSPMGVQGYFTDGNPVTGQPATIVPSEWLNMVMMELINAVKAGGITPDKSNNQQLKAAITKIVESKSPDSYSKAEANATFVDKTAIKQEVGMSDTDVMSQKAMTNALLSATGANKKWVDVLSQRPESVNHTNNTTEVLKVFWGCGGRSPDRAEFYVDGVMMAAMAGSEADEAFFEISIPINSSYMYKAKNAAVLVLMELR